LECRSASSLCNSTSILPLEPLSIPKQDGSRQIPSPPAFSTLETTRSETLTQVHPTSPGQVPQVSLKAWVPGGSAHLALPVNGRFLSTTPTLSLRELTRCYAKKEGLPQSILIHGRSKLAGGHTEGDMVEVIRGRKCCLIFSLYVSLVQGSILYPHFIFIAVLSAPHRNCSLLALYLLRQMLYFKFKIKLIISSALEICSSSILHSHFSFLLLYFAYPKVEHPRSIRVSNW